MIKSILGGGCGDCGCSKTINLVGGGCGCGRNTGGHPDGCGCGSCPS